MSEKQPEALRLADALDERWHRWKDDPTYELKAAAELRRLHAENEDFRAIIDHLTRENAEQIGEIVVLKERRDELLEALRITAQALAWLYWGECRGFHDGPEQPNDALSIARMAIEKATGEQE